MINTKEANVNEVIKLIHEAMQKKTNRNGHMANANIILENRIISAICSDFDMGPSNTALALNDKYGYDLTGDEIIRVFRDLKIANPKERKVIFQWANEVACLFSKAIYGNKTVFDKFEKLRKESPLNTTKCHNSQERIAALMIYEKYPEIDPYDDKENLMLLGNTLVRYFFYDMSDAICEAYGFPLFKESNANHKPDEAQKKLSYSQAVRRVEQLESILDRTNIMLQDLQDEFEEQLELNKVKELTDFFAKLNSEKYGCILDELLIVRKGVDDLRKNNYDLPLEIKGLLIMTKKLIQFVRDSHIEPIMKINSIREVIASDIEFCNYDGTPFTDINEKKTVRVISPGWIYKDKEIQISRPKVKEEQND